MKLLCSSTFHWLVCKMTHAKTRSLIRSSHMNFRPWPRLSPDAGLLIPSDFISLWLVNRIQTAFYSRSVLAASQVGTKKKYKKMWRKERSKDRQHDLWLKKCRISVLMYHRRSPQGVGRDLKTFFPPRFTSFLCEDPRLKNQKWMPL